MTTARATLFGLAIVMASACGREPLEWVCPEVGYGELVITEIRGPQTDTDDEDWIEIYNASGRELDLYGLQLHVRRLNGTSPRTIIVREPGVYVEPSEYAVLGNAYPGSEPTHMRYGFGDDFPVSLYDTAAIDVIACGEQIDRVVYRNLPRTGSLAFDGSLSPDPDLNSEASHSDEQSPWCEDGELQANTGLVGTPGERNRACTD